MSYHFETTFVYKCINNIIVYKYELSYKIYINSLISTPVAGIASIGHYFLAQDELIKEKINYELVYESMLIFYENLKSIDEKLGSNKETLKFLNAYHLSIAELLSVLEINNGLKLLMHYDDEHKKIYESYLIN